MTKRKAKYIKKQDYPDRLLDNPDLLNTEKDSIYDINEDMQTVDPIPVEELNEKVKDEKNKNSTKSTSASEKRYPD